MILRTGANTKHCHSFFFLLSSSMSPFFSVSPSLSRFRLARPSSQTILNCLSVPENKSAVNALPLTFFFCTSREKFPRKLVSFVAEDLSGSHWSAGNREHKGLRACFK